ncbi:hypothetical protein B0T49_09155 [Chromobacterium violaceum]|nr:hypothetical protein B0T48_07410 [Chromobacterium violaceum]OQS51732.1 hypothetical protein B0T49_09155 [Chromobacterium violaceum]
MKLESQFCHLKTLDVSKCFDSIYTHSISWAIKDKKFTKENLDIASSFANEFDALMMHINYNETNGIAIGPELSRIFSEIIFQKIDINVIRKINETYGYNYGNQYTFKRYVDDVFIFAKNKTISEDIYKIYSHSLIELNLHVNREKSKEYDHPFITSKSKLIFEAKRISNEFIDKFLENSSDYHHLKPKKIRSKWNLSRSFIESIKSACSQNNTNYDDISPFIVSVLASRLKKLTKIDTKIDSIEVSNFDDATSIIIQILFFFYGVSPSVSASYKISSAILMLIDFLKKNKLEVNHSIYLEIYNNIVSFIESKTHIKEIGSYEFVPLEIINILLISRELPKDYLIEPQKLRSSLFPNNQANYFGVISGLYYIRDDVRYSEFKAEITTHINTIMKNTDSTKKSSEKANLLLDIISCPYLDQEFRKDIINYAATDLDLKKNYLTRSKMAEFFKEAEKNCNHVDWNGINMLTMLRKKELRRAY